MSNELRESMCLCLHHRAWLAYQAQGLYRFANPSIHQYIPVPPGPYVFPTPCTFF